MEKRKIENIYWFTYYNLDSPSVRYRAKFPLDFAKEKLGISSRLVIPGYSPKSLWNFTKSYISAMMFPKRNSVIVIQRVRSNFIYSNLLKLLVITRRQLTIYDLDDADYLEYNPGIIHYFARNCNYISAGSPEIANYLKQFNSHVYHTTSPTPDLGVMKKERNKLFTIGWVGGFGWGHKDSLYKYLFPAIKELEFECRLTLIGITKESDKKEVLDYFKDHDNVNIEIPGKIDWYDEKGLQEMIKHFDVGIATLLNHPVQLSKSGIKAKQYMNNGIPVICNDLPENNHVVIDHYNGFVCNSVQEFTRRLIELKEMTDKKYWEFSKNAKDSSKNFNHLKWFNDLEQIKNNSKQMLRKQLIAMESCQSGYDKDKN